MSEPGDLPASIADLPNGWFKQMLILNYYKPRDGFVDETNGVIVTEAGRNLVLAALANVEAFQGLAAMAKTLPQTTLVTGL